MKKTEIKTSIVKKMREIRDNLSFEIMDMTFEQEKDFIKSQLMKLKLERLHDVASKAR